VEPNLQALRRQAELHEQQFEWDRACFVYEAILRLDRTAAGVQERYQKCVRRYLQARRSTDISYHNEVLSLDYGQTIHLYQMIRDTLLNKALDRQKADAGLLFRKGIEELDNALTEPSFLQRFLPAARPESIAAFRDFLRKFAGSVEPLSREKALEQLRNVALAAATKLELSSSVVVMEFACGACAALDDYTLYLTPHQLRELCDSLRGTFAGVGLALKMNGAKVAISEVMPFTPAGEIDNPALMKDDQVVSIDGKPTAQMTLEMAQEALEGPIGTTVDLEVYAPGMPPRTVSLRRRAMFAPSVNYRLLSDRVGYMQISSFQDSTVQEIEDAVATLTKPGTMRALILDIRGNSGGLFEGAIEVAKRFLSSGIIASTQNSDPKFNMVYHARNPGALTLPLVVLIDGETASAAEVLAGALKDNKRGRLVGQTTFGKGCTQCILKLPPAKGGIPTGGMRLTVARFFSPEGLPYTGRGVTPHIVVERWMMMDSMNGLDPQMEEAILEAQRLLDPIR
jgi:carboxyl-terminal processing protease